ncbi:hypothetical protein LCGC14_0586270 [marine sediment metagenome]|uniref:Uncharacterized protein n=1 Tax=marine sediment metagenome TaxID=412755 RepID=A0A0F9U0Z7_9ZZZZ
MTNKDLDRLLELTRKQQKNGAMVRDDWKELESLKAKLEGELEKAEKLDDKNYLLIHKEVIEKYSKLEQEIKQLKEKLVGETLANSVINAKHRREIISLKQKLEKIKELEKKYHNMNYSTFSKSLKEILEEKK